MEALDIGYSGRDLDNGELKHRYGDHVHIMADAYHLSLLARLSSDKTTQPEINHLVTTLYRDLVATVLARELPTIEVASTTRMIAHTPQGVYRGRVIDPTTRVVCVDIARAGMLPAQVCFDALNHVLDPVGVPDVVVVAQHHHVDRRRRAGADTLDEVLRDPRRAVGRATGGREHLGTGRLEQGHGVVGRPVVDDDQPVDRTGLPGDAVEQGRQPPARVAGDEHGRDGRHRLATSRRISASYWSVTVSHW